MGRDADCRKEPYKRPASESFAFYTTRKNAPNDVAFPWDCELNDDDRVYLIWPSGGPGLDGVV